MLRLLWDRKIIVALGAIVAVAAALLAGGANQAQSAAGSSGVGSLRMVLDTSDSQLVKAAPRGADTLSMRAALLANALATDTGTELVARKAGVADDQLVILGPAAIRPPVVETPLVTRVAEAAPTANVPNVVRVSADEQTPVMSIEAHAPDASRAARLTQATVAGLRSLLLSEDGAHSRGFVLDTVVPLRSREMASGTHVALPTLGRGALAMLGVALGIFVCWCGCVVLGVGVARKSRQLGRATRRA